MGGDDPVARPDSGGPGPAPTQANLFGVGAICNQALCSVAVPARVPSTGNQVVRFDAYAARR